MTVQELIEKFTELEELNVVFINQNGRCGHIYENDDIDSIDEEQLKLQVEHYDYLEKQFKKRKIRIVDIFCQ